MKKSNTQSLGELLKEYIEAMNISGKLKEVEIINAWEEIVGKNVAKATRDIFIRDRAIYIKFSSSVVRNEISMLKNDLLRRLNEKAGHVVVDKIVFL